MSVFVSPMGANSLSHGVRSKKFSELFLSEKHLLLSHHRSGLLVYYNGGGCAYLSFASRSTATAIWIVTTTGLAVNRHIEYKDV